MSHLINRYILPLPKLIISGLFLILISTIILAGVTNAGNVEGTTEGRLITIHDRGLEKVIVSQAETIGDALKQAGISIDENDAVEPAVDEKLIASDYQVNIYRARPVTVIDGSIRQKIVTPYQTAEQIVKDAGIFLYAEDKLTLGLSNNLVDGAGLELVISRSVPIAFTVYGKTSEVRTLASTVAELLKEKNITISTTDRLSVNLNTEIAEGMALKLWREGKQLITVEETVDFEIEKIYDADQLVGYVQIKNVGEIGARSVTYEVIVVDDKEVSRTEIASIITKQPKSQIEIIGIKVKYIMNQEKTQLMTAAGINESDWYYVDYIIQHESSWNPNAINKSSGACGLAQALPCSKVPGNPYDPVDSLKWANSYAHTCVSYRMYCGWKGAYEFWVLKGWW